MADNSGTSFLGFIVGGVVVVLAILVFAIYSGNLGGGSSSTVKVELPKPSAPK